MAKWVLDEYEISGWKKIFYCDNCQYKLHLMSAKLTPVIADVCPKCRSKMTETIFPSGEDARGED